MDNDALAERPEDEEEEEEERDGNEESDDDELADAAVPAEEGGPGGHGAASGGSSSVEDADAADLKPFDAESMSGQGAGEMTLTDLGAGTSTSLGHLRRGHDPGVLARLQSDGSPRATDAASGLAGLRSADAPRSWMAVRQPLADPDARSARKLPTAADQRLGPGVHTVSAATGDRRLTRQPVRRPRNLRLLAQRACAYVHVPLLLKGRRAIFNNMRIVTCRSCGKHWVPETVLSTLEPPEALPVVGAGVFVEARVVRHRQSKAGEQDCVAIGRDLPFVDMAVMEQLAARLKIMGCNCAFSLRPELVYHAGILMATVCATGFFCESLPPPPPVRVQRSLPARGAQAIAAEGAVVLLANASREAITLAARAVEVGKRARLAAIAAFKRRKARSPTPARVSTPGHLSPKLKAAASFSMGSVSSSLHRLAFPAPSPGTQAAGHGAAGTSFAPSTGSRQTPLAFLAEVSEGGPATDGRIPGSSGSSDTGFEPSRVGDTVQAVDAAAGGNDSQPTGARKGGANVATCGPRGTALLGLSASDSAGQVSHGSGIEHARDDSTASAEAALQAATAVAAGPAAPAAAGGGAQAKETTQTTASDPDAGIVFSLGMRPADAEAISRRAGSHQDSKRGQQRDGDLPVYVQRRWNKPFDPAPPALSSQGRKALLHSSSSSSSEDGAGHEDDASSDSDASGASTGTDDSRDAAEADSTRAYVLEVDDEQDEAVLAALNDRREPAGMRFTTAELPPGRDYLSYSASRTRPFAYLLRFRLDEVEMETQQALKAAQARSIAAGLLEPMPSASGAGAALEAVPELSAGDSRGETAAAGLWASMAFSGVGATPVAGLPGADLGYNASASSARVLDACMRRVYGFLCLRARHLSPCTIACLRTQLDLPDQVTLDVLVTGIMIVEPGRWLEDRPVPATLTLSGPVMADRTHRHAGNTTAATALGLRIPTVSRAEQIWRPPSLVAPPIGAAAARRLAEHNSAAEAAALGDTISKLQSGFSTTQTASGAALRGSAPPTGNAGGAALAAVGRALSLASTASSASGLAADRAPSTPHQPQPRPADSYSGMSPGTGAADGGEDDGYETDNTTDSSDAGATSAAAAAAAGHRGHSSQAGDGTASSAGGSRAGSRGRPDRAVALELEAAQLGGASAASHRRRKHPGTAKVHPQPPNSALAAALSSPSSAHHGSLGRDSRLAVTPLGTLARSPRGRSRAGASPSAQARTAPPGSHRVALPQYHVESPDALETDLTAAGEWEAALSSSATVAAHVAVIATRARDASARYGATTAPGRDAGSPAAGSAANAAPAGSGIAGANSRGGCMTAATAAEVLSAAQTAAAGDDSTTPAAVLQAAALAASATGASVAAQQAHADQANGSTATASASVTAAASMDVLGRPPANSRGVSAPAAVSLPGAASRPTSLLALTGAIARQDSTGVVNALGPVMPRPGVGVPAELHRSRISTSSGGAASPHIRGSSLGGSRGSSLQLLDTASQVILSPMSEVPGCKTRSYHGRLNMHFVRETDNVRELGGTARFLQLIITEAAAVARAQALALGANALVGYRVNPRESTDRSRRNQAYHVVSVSGDAVTVEPDTG